MLQPLLHCTGGHCHAQLTEGGIHGGKSHSLGRQRWRERVTALEWRDPPFAEWQGHSPRAKSCLLRLDPANQCTVQMQGNTLHKQLGKMCRQSGRSERKPTRSSEDAGYETLHFSRQPSNHAHCAISTSISITFSLDHCQSLAHPAPELSQPSPSSSSHLELRTGCSRQSRGVVVAWPLLCSHLLLGSSGGNSKHCLPVNFALCDRRGERGVLSR